MYIRMLTIDRKKQQGVRLRVTQQLSLTRSATDAKTCGSAALALIRRRAAVDKAKTHRK